MELTFHIDPGEQIQAEYLFLLGFGDRMIDGTQQFESSWQYRLASAEGKILLGGPAYPATLQEVLSLARTFYRLGYMCVDILLGETPKTSWSRT